MATARIDSSSSARENLTAKLNESKSFEPKSKVEGNKEAQTKPAPTPSQDPPKTENSKPSVNTQGQVTGTRISTTA
jgi:hypothetical protein